MSSQESTRSALSVKKSFKKLRERHTRLERERDNLVKNVLRTKDVDSLKINSLRFSLADARRELFWAKYDSGRLRELMRKINAARGDFACGCSSCDRYDRHPGVHLAGYKSVPCSFVTFLPEFLSAHLDVELHVCGAREPLNLCKHPSVGFYSDKDYHLVAAHDWSNVYYGSKIVSRADDVDVEPIQEVLDLFNVPYLLSQA